MKTVIFPLSLLVAVSFVDFLHAQPPVVIYAPTTPTTVVSPLTNATSQSNQALLDQINATISQQRFQQQILSAQFAPVLAPSVSPRVITR